jgi:hypothetical protein
MGLGQWQPLERGNPGWRFWVVFIGFLVAAYLAVRLFYRP